MTNQKDGTKSLHALPGLFILAAWALGLAFGDHLGDVGHILNALVFWAVLVSTPLRQGFAGRSQAHLWKMVGGALAAIGFVCCMTLMGVGMGGEGPGMFAIMLPVIAVGCALYCVAARALFHLGVLLKVRLRGSKPCSATALEEPNLRP